MIDLISARRPDEMTEIERRRLVSMVASYADVEISVIGVVSVTETNSTRIRLELPRSAADKIVTGYKSNDPLLAAFSVEFDLMRIDSVSLADQELIQQKDLQEKEENSGSIDESTQRGVYIKSSMALFGAIVGLITASTLYLLDLESSYLIAITFLLALIGCVQVVILHIFEKERTSSEKTHELPKETDSRTSHKGSEDNR